MLNKINHVKNIGRFYDVTIQGTPDSAAAFKKFNLIYADNGTGKSTISTILKSLWQEEPQRLFEKYTIGATDSSFVELEVSNKTYKFEKNEWNQKPGIALAIFDDEFVEKNVFSLSEVKKENRRELLNYIIFDEPTVAKVNEIESLNNIIKTHLRPQIEATEEKLKQITGINGIGILDNTTKLEDSDLENLRNKVNQTATTIKDVQLIVTSKPLDKISNFEPISYKDSISADLSSLSLDAQHKTHIQTHNAWLKDGLNIVQNEDRTSCPFCLQDIEGRKEIDIYKAVFSDEYTALRAQIEKHLTDVERIYSDAAIKNKLNVIESNNERCILWHRHDKEIPESIPLSFPLEESIKEFKIALKNLLQKKQNSLLEKTPPDQGEAQELDKEAQFREAIVNYNNAIDDINNRIKIVQDSVQNLEELKRINEYERKKIVCNDVKFHNPETVKLYKQLEQYRQEVKDAKKTITKLRKEIDQESQTILRKYQNNINKELANFGVDFSIQEVGRAADPASKDGVRFNICLKGKSFTPNGSPSNRYKLSNTLSSGDKSTLAFAFFIAKYCEKDLSNQILVFDDPITSLDFFRRAQTKSAIQKFLNNGAQIIVLTHSIKFAELISSIKTDTKGDKYFMWIRKDDSSSGLSYLCGNKFSDINPDRPSHDHYLIQQYINDPTSVDYYDLINSIRSYVETKIKRSYHNFSSLSLGLIIGKLRDEKNICDDYIEKLGNINDIIAPVSSHGGVDELEYPGDEELRIICETAIDLPDSPYKPTS